MQIQVEDGELRSPIAIQWDHRVSDDEFKRFCGNNPDLRVERSAAGDIVVMPPTGAETGFRNSQLTAQLADWARKDGRGQAFDSSTGYLLPDSAVLSPDASWVLKSRLQQLSKEQKRGLAPLCPDFVVELMSPSDRLAKVKAKMREWMDNGTQLGWLLDPDHRVAYIYRPGGVVEQLPGPERLAGEGPVAGLVVELTSIWAGI